MLIDPQLNDTGKYQNLLRFPLKDMDSGDNHNCHQSDLMTQHQQWERESERGEQLLF